MRTHKLRIVVLGSAAVLALVLSACASGEPDLTPLPSTDASTVAEETASVPEKPGVEDLPLVAEPPATESAAIDWAVRATYGYIAVEGDVMNNHPDDTSELALIAKGNASDLISYYAGRLAETGNIRSGNAYYEALAERSSVATSGDASATRFGRVEVWGCYGSGDVTLTDADGKPLEHANIPPAPMWLLAEYDATSSIWYIVDIDPLPQDAAFSC